MAKKTSGKTGATSQNASKEAGAGKADLSSAGGEAAKKPPMADATRLTAIGHAIWLMSRSPLHKHLMITDTEWLVTPPILLSQFRLWQQNGTPTGFASWAYLGEEAEDRIVNRGIRRLMPTDWKSGETLWLIDFIAPFGGEENMMKELRDSVHKDKKLKMLRPGPDGKLGVMEW